MCGTIAKAVALCAAAVALCACSASPATSSRPARPSGSRSSPLPHSVRALARIKACLVTNTGGVDDHSFNAASWQGVQEAVAADPAEISGIYLQSASAGDYTPNIDKAISEKCGLIVTVGFLMGGNTEAAAAANPAQKFAIVDYAYGRTIKNIDAITFDTAQDGFLGGYLAAGMTRTGKVATYGGQQLSTVTGYLDGFWDGVHYYNAQHHTHVAVLGWNEPAQSGSFTGSFTSQADAQALTQTFISEGADIIFPVAETAGLGTAKAVQNADAAARSDRVNMMWSDTDGCVSVPQYCKYLIASVTQGIQQAVKSAILAAAGGTFAGGTYTGDLANGGVALSPYHDFAGKVPAALTAELQTIKAEIENGTIKPAAKSPA